MVTGVIMASGFSSRMKADKLLLKINEITLIERVIAASSQSKLKDIVLVYRRDEVRDIADKYGIKAIKNNNADRGQSESIKLGLSNLSSDSKGIMFIVSDQPFLDSDTIDKIINEFEKNSESIIIPKYNNKKGNPTIFPTYLKDDFYMLEGDVGGKALIDKNPKLVKYVDIENYIAGIDMDTKEEYEKLKGGY